MTYQTEMTDRIAQIEDLIEYAKGAIKDAESQLEMTYHDQVVLGWSDKGTIVCLQMVARDPDTVPEGALGTWYRDLFVSTTSPTRATVFERTDIPHQEFLNGKGIPARPFDRKTALKTFIQNMEGMIKRMDGMLNQQLD